MCICPWFPLAVAGGGAARRQPRGGLHSEVRSPEDAQTRLGAGGLSRADAAPCYTTQHCTGKEC